MNEHILSIDKCTELLSLGVDMNDANIWWIKSLDNSFEPELTIYKVFKHVYSLIGDKVVRGYELIPAYTLQDILRKLPKPCYINCFDNDFYEVELTTDTGSRTTSGKTPLIAAYNMLKICKESKQL